jgi:PAS domain S-box-containing protein
MPPSPRQTSPASALELVAGLSVIVYRLDAQADYRLCELNGAVEDLTGYRAADLLADDDFTTGRIHPDDRMVVAGRLSDLLSTGCATAEYRFQRADGRYVWFRDRLRLIARDDGEPADAVGTTSDITDVVEARLHAEADEAKLKGVVAAATSAIIVTSDRGGIESFNRAAEKMFGYAESDVLGRNVTMLMPPAEANGHGGHMGRYAADGEPRVVGTRREVLGQRRDGSTFPLHLALSEARYEGALHFCGILTDVTETRELERELRALNAELEQRVAERTAHLEREVAERKQAQDSLGVAEHEHQLLLGRILDLQDRERAHISYELHDQVGQQLTSLMIGLRVLSVTDTAHDLRERAAELRATVADTLEQVRSLAVETRSSSLDDLGLATTLRTELRAMQEQADVRVTLDARGCENPRLPLPTEMSLHGIAHGALENITQHARASNVGVYIRRAGDTVTVLIEDDGVGFDVDAVMAGPVDSRFGLLGMQERARAADGEATVESAPGEGCAVLVSLPIGVEEPS